jgi:GAF domain-containing protein
MAQPLIIGDRVRGVVTMSRSGDDAGPFQPDDLPLLESFAAQAAIALENARLYHAAETRAGVVTRYTIGMRNRR